MAPAAAGPGWRKAWCWPSSQWYAGKPAVKVLSDGWTAVTRDGSLSAHFEHTVVVTRGGCEILTLLPADAERAKQLLGAPVRSA